MAATVKCIFCLVAKATLIEFAFDGWKQYDTLQSFSQSNE